MITTAMTKMNGAKSKEEFQALDAQIQSLNRKIEDTRKQKSNQQSLLGQLDEDK